MSEENNNQNNYSFWAEQLNSNSQASNNQSAPINPNANFYSPYPPFSGFSSQQPQDQAPKKNKKGKKVFAFIGKAAAFGVIAGLTFYGSNLLINNLKGENKQTSHPSVTLSGNLNKDLNLDKPSTGTTIPPTTVSTNVNIESTDVSQVVADTMPSIVSITSTFNNSYNVWGYEYGGESTGGGSGIIIGEKDGTLYIATNNHVVEAATKIMVTFSDGTEAEAQIRGRNSAADLAVITLDTKNLKKDTLEVIKVAKLGNSDDVKVGQMAIAIGNALGYGQSVTVGYISAKDREINVEKGTKLTVLQTDAAINPGNSGGALINIKGEVIGINSAKLAQTSVEGIGYSIPITNAYPIVDELMNREILTEDEMGYLGLYPQDVNESVAQMYDWPIGVYVNSLVDGGAAQKAGIYAGDIITSINDITISSSEQLRDTVNSYRYGTKVTVTLMRLTDGEYKEMTVEVVLQKKNDGNEKETPTTQPKNDAPTVTPEAPTPDIQDPDGSDSSEWPFPFNIPGFEFPGE
ncbi:MAG: trypsin-like peptidase domain-containing protein [Clostridiales bacterium]|nr:trypsin-like peptidase domain-containing protein [Clostridiales bacterium]